MERCTKCGFPNTRPGIIFKDGICQACINYEGRKYVDWATRQNELKLLCLSHKGKGKYDCIIPVSGGKDSYFLVHTLVREMGMRPLLVTVTDPFTHTEAGSHNLKNLRTIFNLPHWQYAISPDLFRRVTRAAFEDTGEPLKFVEYAIYTIPVMLAKALDISLVFFGENSGFEYGNTEENYYDANPDIENMMVKIDSERAWWNAKGISNDEIDSILPATGWRDDVQVCYMSYFKPWSSLSNLEIAKKYGFRDLAGEWARKGTIENFEQIDSVAYMVHLWMKYPKFGFQRVSDIASRRVREGAMTLREARIQMLDKDPQLDPWAKSDFCNFCEYDEGQFAEIVNKFWNPEVPRD